MFNFKVTPRIASQIAIRLKESFDEKYGKWQDNDLFREYKKTRTFNFLKLNALVRILC